MQTWFAKTRGELSLSQKPSVSQLLTHKCWIPPLKVPTGNKDCPVLLLQFDYENISWIFFFFPKPYRAACPSSEKHSSMWQLFPSITHASVSFYLSEQLLKGTINSWGRNWDVLHREINSAIWDTKDSAIKVAVIIASIITTTVTVD